MKKFRKKSSIAARSGVLEPPYFKIQPSKIIWKNQSL